MILKGVRYDDTESNKVSRNKSDGKMCMTFLGENYKTLLNDIKRKYNTLMGRETEYCKDVKSPQIPLLTEPNSN